MLYFKIGLILLILLILFTIFIITHRVVYNLNPYILVVMELFEIELALLFDQLNLLGHLFEFYHGITSLVLLLGLSDLVSFVSLLHLSAVWLLCGRSKNDT